MKIGDEILIGKKSSKIKKSSKLNIALMATVVASTTVGANALPFYAYGLDETTSSQKVVEVSKDTISTNAKNTVNAAAESEMQVTMMVLMFLVVE